MTSTKTADPHLDAPAPIDGRPLDAEALIPEARDRQRRRHRHVGLLSAIALVLLIVGFVSYRDLSTNGSGPAGGGRGTVVPAGPFAGTWHLQANYLTIDRDGRGTATFEWSLTPTIWVKVHASIIITAVHGDRARGEVTRTTTSSYLPDGPIALRVDQANDLIYVTPSHPTTTSPYGRVPLCGPRIYENLKRQEMLHIHCGA